MAKNQTNTDKVERCLKILENNGYNWNKTSKDTGVTRPTLKRWAKLYGNTLLKESAYKSIVHPPDEPREKKIERCSLHALKLKEALLNKMLQLLPRISNFDTLTRALKVVADLEKDDGTDPSSQAINNSSAFLQLIINNIKTKNKNGNTEN